MLIHPRKTRITYSTTVSQSILVQTLILLFIFLLLFDQVGTGNIILPPLNVGASFQVLLDHQLGGRGSPGSSEAAVLYIYGQSYLRVFLGCEGNKYGMIFPMGVFSCTRLTANSDAVHPGGSGCTAGPGFSVHCQIHPFYYFFIINRIHHGLLLLAKTSGDVLFALNALDDVGGIKISAVGNG